MKNTDKLNILSILPHMGGGLGAVMPSFIDSIDANHIIACLEVPQNVPKINSEIFIDMIYNIRQLKSLIRESDICVIHMYNHPLLYKFLLENKLPECRLIYWYHNLGMFAPYIIRKELIDMSDMFITTTPASFQVPTVEQVIKNSDTCFKVRNIFSTRGVDQFLNIPPKIHDGWRIGYVGTLDYSKLHPNFVKMCSKVKGNTVKFVLCGEPSKELLRDIKDSGIEERFEILGKVSNVPEILQTIDIFGYPLSPYQYGSSEQVICESQAMGIPAVVLGNLPESFLIKDKYNGLVASENNYHKAIHKLMKDENFYGILSINAKVKAQEIYSIENLTRNWTEVINNVKQLTKKERKLISDPHKITGFEIFDYSVGGFKEEMLKDSLQWDSETKGSPRHYLKYFPDDIKLHSIIKQLDKIYDKS